MSEEKVMEKIAVVLGSNIHWAPYYYRYEKLLTENGKSFDLVFWNREGIEEKTIAPQLPFYLTDTSNNKDPFKWWKFIAFSSFAKKIIKKNKYDKLIFLGTHGCVINLCAFFLEKHYKNKMWIDVRDDMYEWFPPLYWGEKKSIKNSFATTISSPEFRKFLPEHDYLMMHNIDPNAVAMKKQFISTQDSENRIRISFIGNVRYYKQNKALMNRLGNDKRFKIQYYGNGSEELRCYCEEKGYKNVNFHGSFKQEETLSFYEKTDIINNIYGNETMNLQVALSNKLYYGLCLEMPILVSENTFMEKITKSYNIGFTFEDKDAFADELYKWYNDIKAGHIKAEFNKLWDKVMQEDTRSIEKFKEFVLDR